MSAPSYVHGAAARPLLGETIGANLRRTVARFPERDALIVRSQGFRATYRQLWNLTTRLARALLRRGIARGDRVGIWAPAHSLGTVWLTIQLMPNRSVHCPK